MDFLQSASTFGIYLKSQIKDASALIAGDYSRLFHCSIDEDAAGQFRAAQLEGIRKNTMCMVIANLFNASLLIGALWDTPMRLTALCWAAVILACVATSAAPLWRQGGLRARKSRGISAATMRRAIRNAALLGCAWGLAPILFFGAAPPDARFILTCVCAGLVGGGAFMLSSLPAAVIALIGPILAGSIIAVAGQEGAGSAPHASSLAICAVFYGIFLICVACSQSRALLTRQAKKIELEQMAERDALTNLPNATKFRRVMAQAEARLSSAGEGYSVFAIDIDNLRGINQRFGYLAGDDVLRQAAAKLKEKARSQDVLARLDGDQFALLAAGLDGAATIMAYARKLKAAIDEPFKRTYGEIAVSVSIGVAAARAGASRGDDHLRNATLALFRAQADGKNVVRVYSDADAESLQARDALETDLRAAMDSGGLKLHFQPFLNIQKNTVVGFEALLRWRHPLRGQIPPQEIIDLAEERGLIDMLGAYVLNEACRAAVAWPPHLRVAVNVSPIQLRSRALAGVVEAALRNSGLPAHQLEIEVTENALIVDHDLARHVLLSLRAIGVHLALDDFGVGFSLLNYLWSLPFDRLKIDKSFVDQVLINADAATIVRSVIHLAADLRLNVTAEGIESAGQLDFLRENGCGEAQGFLISKAMEERAIEAFLRKDETLAAA